LIVKLLVLKNVIIIVIIFGILNLKLTPIPKKKQFLKDLMISKNYPIIFYIITLNFLQVVGYLNLITLMMSQKEQ